MITSINLLLTTANMAALAIVAVILLVLFVVIFITSYFGLSSDLSVPR